MSCDAVVMDQPLSFIKHLSQILIYINHFYNFGSNVQSSPSDSHLRYQVLINAGKSETKQECAYT